MYITKISRYTLDVTPIINKLDSMREEHGSEWGIRKLELQDDVTDAGLEELLAYAVRNPHLSRLILHLRGCLDKPPHLDAIIPSINSSSLTTLSLLGDSAPTAESLIRLFNGLNAPRLDCLTLVPSADGGDRVINAIAVFLRSPRSRALRTLQLVSRGGRASEYGPLDRLVDTIETRNFAMEILSMPETEGTEQASETHPQLFANRDRLSVCFRRNKSRSSHHDPRVQEAALRYLAAARILVNAHPLPSTPPKPLIPLRRSARKAAVLPAVIPPAEPPFRLLDLPAEIRDQILRNASGDIGALSRSQLSRLRHAAGMEGLREMVIAARGAGDEFRDQWLRWAGLNSWEEEEGE